MGKFERTHNPTFCRVSPEPGSTTLTAHGREALKNSGNELPGVGVLRLMVLDSDSREAALQRYIAAVKRYMAAAAVLEQAAPGHEFREANQEEEEARAEYEQLRKEVRGESGLGIARHRRQRPIARGIRELP
jgi:hypothetical protein